MSRSAIQREMQALCEEWKPALKLEGWNIRVIVEPAARMGKDTGRCKWYLQQRAAVIRMVDPREAHLVVEQDLALSSNSIFDSEVTVVHEMLHCLYAPYDAKVGTLESIAQEQSIETLSETLVALKRRAAAV